MTNGGNMGLVLCSDVSLVFREETFGKHLEDAAFIPFFLFVFRSFGPPSVFDPLHYKQA